MTENPTLSMCDGNETGQALDDCTCASITPTTPMIECIKQCSTTDQSAYAASLPSECRGTLFPGVSVTPSSGSGATTSGQSTQTVASTDATSKATSTSATNAATSTAAKSANDAIRADPTAIAMVMGIAAAFAF